MTAKPVVDVTLVVPDPADEAAYAEALQGAGYTFALREPEWFEHRLFRDTAPRVNLHVFGDGCPEVTAVLAFRDHLRADEADRALYLRTKRELAARKWERVQDYADAKADVVGDIISRALPGDGSAEPGSDRVDREVDDEHPGDDPHQRVHLARPCRARS